MVFKFFFEAAAGIVLGATIALLPAFIIITRIRRT